MFVHALEKSWPECPMNLETSADDRSRETIETLRLSSAFSSFLAFSAFRTFFLHAHPLRCALSDAHLITPPTFRIGRPS